MTRKSQPIILYSLTDGWRGLQYRKATSDGDGSKAFVYRGRDAPLCSNVRIRFSIGRNQQEGYLECLVDYTRRSNCSSNNVDKPQKEISKHGSKLITES